MDKYEYQVCADQINAFISERRFAEAMEIADKIDWRRVKSVSMLCTVSEVYKINKRYDESLEILLLAYDRYPEGRTIVYALCELAIKMDDVVAAVEYYKQYMRIAPEDTNSYVLLYKIYEAQDVTLEERIHVLEEFKKRDYREKWAYELARLYDKTGQINKCIAECDELILWFGEGKYVRKAMELKMEHTDLTPDQQRKYEGRPDPQVVEAYGQPISEPYNKEGYTPQELYSGQPYTPPQYQEPDYGDNIQVQPVNTGRYSTMNLQEELARSMEAFMTSEQTDVQGNYYGQTAQLYEPAQNPDAYSNPYGADYEQSFEAQNNIYQQNISNLSALQQAYENENYVSEESSEPEEIPEPSYIPEVPEISEPVQERPSNTDKRFESVLSQEYDGQISLSLPDTEMVEKQITGQINLEDILNGWEDRKKETEQRRNLGETGDIMSQLQGVIPGTRPDVLPSGRIMTLEEEYSGKINQIRKEDERILAQKIVPETNADTAPVPEPIKEDEIIVEVTPVETEPQYEPAVERATEPEAEPEEAVPFDATSDEMIYETEVEESVAEVEDEIPKPVMEDIMEDKTKQEFVTEYLPTIPMAGTDPVIEADVSVTEPSVEEEAFVQEATSELEAAPEPKEDSTEEAIPVMPIQGNIPQVEVAPVEEVTSEPVVEEMEETVTEAEVTPEPVAEEEEEPADPMAPFMNVDYGEVEEIEDIDQPDDIDEMIKTTNMPIADIERLAQANYEAGIEPVEEDKPRNHPSYMVLEEAVVSKRDFTEDEKRVFVRFEGIESIKAQIVETMDILSMQASHGNVIVLGPENCGRKGLALDIVKAIQSRDENFSGKVAKISGEALNKKNIPITIKKLRNGALIVENADGLTIDSVNIITEALMQETDPVLVILEGERESVQPLISASMYANTVFNARIEINPFTNDDLVAYGKGYAREQEYSIDEMGVLALYTRIGELQTLDHVVSVDEVKEIIDAAIKHVDRKNMTHFMDVLVGKRYDDDDYIVLREKDFVI